MILVKLLAEQQPVGRWAATQPAVGLRVELKQEPVSPQLICSRALGSSFALRTWSITPIDMLSSHLWFLDDFLA